MSQNTFPNHAPSLLGETYEKGMGVESDLNKAFYYYLIAADYGNDYSKNQIERVAGLLFKSDIVTNLKSSDPSKAIYKLFALTTQVGWGDEFFESRFESGSSQLKEWIDNQMAPYAKSASCSVRGAYAMMLLFDAERFSKSRPQRAIDQLLRAFMISEEAYDAGNPHITVGNFYFNPSHIARRAAFRLTDLFYSQSDYKNSEEFSYYALDKKYNNRSCDSLLDRALDKVSYTLGRLYLSGYYEKAIDIFHQFFKVLYEYETYDEVAPVDEILNQFINKL